MEQSAPVACRWFSEDVVAAEGGAFSEEATDDNGMTALL